MAQGNPRQIKRLLTRARRLRDSVSAGYRADRMDIHQQREFTRLQHQCQEAWDELRQALRHRAKLSLPINVYQNAESRAYLATSLKLADPWEKVGTVDVSFNRLDIEGVAQAMVDDFEDRMA